VLVVISVCVIRENQPSPSRPWLSSVPVLIAGVVKDLSLPVDLGILGTSLENLDVQSFGIFELKLANFYQNWRDSLRLQVSISQASIQN